MGFGGGDMLKVIYDSDLDGRIEKDALEITLDKLLKGAGSGLDPTEIDVPAAAKTIATGTYTGNETGRQVAVGFKCSMVIVLGEYSKVIGVLVPNAGLTCLTSGAETTTADLHATDGFSLTASANPQDLNENSDPYYYWAISE